MSDKPKEAEKSECADTAQELRARIKAARAKLTELIGRKNLSDTPISRRDLIAVIELL